MVIPVAVPIPPTQLPPRHLLQQGLKTTNSKLKDVFEKKEELGKLSDDELHQILPEAKSILAKETKLKETKKKLHLALNQSTASSSSEKTPSDWVALKS